MFHQVMEDVLGNRSAQAVVVISTKPGCFIAGADVGLVKCISCLCVCACVCVFVSVLVMLMCVSFLLVTICNVFVS